MTIQEGQRFQARPSAPYPQESVTYYTYTDGAEKLRLPLIREEEKPFHTAELQEGVRTPWLEGFGEKVTSMDFIREGRIGGEAKPYEQGGIDGPYNGIMWSVTYEPTTGIKTFRRVRDATAEELEEQRLQEMYPYGMPRPEKK